jgi:hypothetical protein
VLNEKCQRGRVGRSWAWGKKECLGGVAVGVSRVGEGDMSE